MNDFAIGTKVQRTTMFDDVGEIVEVEEARVRVLWPATSPVSHPKRTWLATKGFGKRWKLAAAQS